MKEQILELRAKGKTYNEIVSIVGCSKATVSYHCGEGQKEKSYNRTKKNRLNLRSILFRKIEGFTRNKVRNFKRGRPDLVTNSSIVYEDAFKKLINSPSCYITGRKIDLEDTKTYQLDHIIPRAKGGSNDLKNMGLACRDANVSKFDLSLSEYLSLCKEVLEFNGYEVNKK